ncbi:hypothetical protein D3C72_2235350 [compost metagenome]
MLDSHSELLRMASFSAPGVKYHRLRGKLPPMPPAKPPGKLAVAPFFSSDQISPGLAPSGDSASRLWSA